MLHHIICFDGNLFFFSLEILFLAQYFRDSALTLFTKFSSAFHLTCFWIAEAWIACQTLPYSNSYFKNICFYLLCTEIKHCQSKSPSQQSKYSKEVPRSKNSCSCCLPGRTGRCSHDLKPSHLPLVNYRQKMEPQMSFLFVINGRQILAVPINCCPVLGTPRFLINLLKLQIMQGEAQTCCRDVSPRITLRQSALPC